jgi:uncharacterized protein
VRVERDIPVPMRDGTLLAADVYRPRGGGPHPVILMRVPYDKTYAQTNTFRHPSWYAEQGYIVVVQDTRGRYRSDGEFEPFAHEADDGFDTVEWAAALPGANGRVGMYGLSYAGATQLQAALRRPPSLRAICPGITSARYHEGWAYRGSAFALAFNVFWAGLLAGDQARRAGDGARARELAVAVARCRELCDYLPLRELPPLADAAPYFRDWLDHPSYDDYWRRWSVDGDYARVDVPALHIGGWYDIFAGGTVANYRGLRAGAGSEAARSSQRLLMGPWHHEIQEGGGFAGHVAGDDVSVDAWQLRWFDQFLRDADTGVLDGGPARLHLLGGGRWLETDWPPPASVEEWFLHADDGANSVLGDGLLARDAPGPQRPDVFVFNPLGPVESAGGTSCCVPGLVPMGAACQADVEIRRDVLVYTSAPLERDLTLAGDVRLRLFCASSAEDTDFTAKLCDVDPDGRSVNLVQGILRCRYRESLAEPAPLVPGEVYELTLELGPVAALLARGHRLRLQVSSSDFPLWSRNLNRYEDPHALDATAAITATQTVLHDDAHPSRLELPILDG